MEIAQATIDTAQRLMQAWENSRVSEGTGRISESRGPVPHELAEQFRMLMEQPQQQQPQMSVGETQAVTDSRGKTGETRFSDTDNRPVDGVSEAGPENLVSPMDFLQMQFETKMIVFGTRLLSSVQQSVKTELEQRLRAQEG